MGLGYLMLLCGGGWIGLLALDRARCTDQPGPALPSADGRFVAQIHTQGCAEAIRTILVVLDHAGGARQEVVSCLSGDSDGEVLWLDVHRLHVTDCAASGFSEITWRDLQMVHCPDWSINCPHRPR